MFVGLPVKVNDGARSESIPVANGLIIALNVLFYFLGVQMVVGPGSGLFSIIGYGFSHSGVTHLIVNMWLLLVLGNAVNRRVGNGFYLLGYLGTVVSLGLFARLFAGNFLVGSSGGIYAVIAMMAMLLPSVLVDIFYVAVFPITVLIGLVSRPAHWLFWIIRWDRIQLRAWWFILLVPIMQIMGLVWWGWNWTNLAGSRLQLRCNKYDPPLAILLQGTNPGRQIDLMAYVEPAKGAVSGKWTLEDGRLIADASDAARISLPFYPPQEIRLHRRLYGSSIVRLHCTTGIPRPNRFRLEHECGSTPASAPGRHRRTFGDRQSNAQKSPIRTGKTLRL